MDSMSVQMIDQEIKKFGEFMTKFQKLFENGYMSYSMFESQHTQLRAIAEKLKAQNAEAEANLNKTISSNELIIEEGKKQMEKAMADIQVLYAKANAKYKDFENILEASDKKRAKELLKGIEVLAS